MIVGYHVIFGAYGFWLPNDARGSWSDFVGSWDVLRYGGATMTADSKSHAYREDYQALRLAAKSALKYPAVEFTGLQARAVARGFAEYAHRSELPVWACAILPDHVHLVMGKPKIDVQQVAIQLKGHATRQLESEGIHPLAWCKAADRRIPKCFARGEWTVFLDADDVPHAVNYVEENPVKEGKKSRKWSFVVPYPRCSPDDPDSIG